MSWYVTVDTPSGPDCYIDPLPLLDDVIADALERRPDAVRITVGLEGFDRDVVWEKDEEESE